MFMKVMVGLVLAITTVAADGSFWNPLVFIKEFQDGLEFIDKLDQEGFGVKTDFEEKPLPGKRHLRVKGIVTDLWTDFTALFQYPSWGAFIALLVDLISYGIMPLEGGYMGDEVHDQYIKDQRAYGDAGVTEDYLFKQSTNMWKERFWQFWGMFHRTSEPNN